MDWVTYILGYCFIFFFGSNNSRMNLNQSQSLSNNPLKFFLFYTCMNNAIQTYCIVYITVSFFSLECDKEIQLHHLWPLHSLGWRHTLVLHKTLWKPYLHLWSGRLLKKKNNLKKYVKYLLLADLVLVLVLFIILLADLFNILYVIHCWLIL